MKAIIKLYIDSNLSKEMEARVKLWLLDETRKKEKEEALWELWNAVEHVCEEEHKRIAWKAVQRKIKLRAKQKQPVIKTIMFRIAVVVIPTLLIVGAVVYLNSGNQVIQSEKVITKNETKNIVLTDETEIQLNKNTEFIYSEDRASKLTGEAYFEVAKVGEQKFSVQTGSITSTVKGTNFNIRAYNEEEKIIISLYQGNLEVRVEDKLIMMNSGDEIVYNKQTNELQQQYAMGTFPEWTKSYLSYDKEELRNIFKDFEQRHSVKIVVGTEDILDETITFKVEKNTTIDEKMQMLSQISSGEFNYEIQSDIIYIY